MDKPPLPWCHGSSVVELYNDRRPHWALIPEEGGDPLVPKEVYTSARSIQIPKWQGWAKGAKEKLDRMMSEAA
ncbi:MAG: hypothetical protein HQ567_34320 [Candidatus Nealsonbacteria bacterium]|nr:hypothetical protein [Candidatus Nealsonbacteria bacterium]